MRRILFTILLFAISISSAYAVNLSYLETLPNVRHEALLKAKETRLDSTPDIAIKREAYYTVLKGMIGQIRSRYYFHNDFPTNLCEGLENYALVLAGIQYPLSGSTGCSRYDAIVDETKVQLAEKMVCQMVQAIYEEALWDQKANKPSTQSIQLYITWFKRWNTSSTADPQGAANAKPPVHSKTTAAPTPATVAHPIVISPKG